LLLGKHDSRRVRLDDHACRLFVDISNVLLRHSISV
jgi:hypothetical protein